MHRLLTILLVLAALLVPRAARANDNYSWTMPSAEQQLAVDETVIPIGKGAVFIPSITGSEFEPPTSIVDGDEIVSIAVGQRVLIDPGPYVVIISSGSASQGTSVAVDVVEGETTLVPVTWGALRIEVVDDRRIPHRGSYELIRADTRQPVGTGFGADTLQGELLQTWLLSPGVYRIVRPGRNSRALRDFATVVVPESGFVRYRLVMDPDTGDFLGSGILLPGEFTSSTEQNTRWFRSAVLGVDGSLVSNSYAVGTTPVTQVNASVFLDSQFAFSSDPHKFSLLFQIEEGALQRTVQNADQESEQLPIEKVTDRLRADVLYTYSLYGRTGPYARVSAESQIFPTDILVSEEGSYVIIDEEEDPDSYNASNYEPMFLEINDTFHISDAWSPTIIREGVGINTTFLQKSRSMNFNWRVGYGMRQNLYNDTLVNEDSPGTDLIEYQPVSNFFQRGIESTVVASLRLPGRIVYATDLEFFVPFDVAGDAEAWQEYVAASWRNTISLRITRNLSLNYFLDVDIEPEVVTDRQVEQSLFLRASWSIF